MFRCPSCAKVHKVFVNTTHSVLANKDMNTFWYVKEPFAKGTVAQAFNNMLFKMNTDADHIGENEFGQKVVSMDDVCKCSSCDHVALFGDFYDAHLNPIDYFDAEELCSCGEELWMDQVPGMKRYGLVCDACGWVKPDSIVSGNADTTSK